MIVRNLRFVPTTKDVLNKYYSGNSVTLKLVRFHILIYVNRYVCYQIKNF